MRAVSPRFTFDQSAELGEHAYNVTEGRTGKRLGAIYRGPIGEGWLADGGGNIVCHRTMRAAAEWLLAQHTKATANV